MASVLEKRAIIGMRFKLERKADKAEPCCNGFAHAEIFEGEEVELLCDGCGHSKGILHKEAVEWVLTFLAFWPEAIKDVHVLRDYDPYFTLLDLRRGKKKGTKKKGRKQEEPEEVESD
jgi:hypothetical protein